MTARNDVLDSLESLYHELASSDDMQQNPRKYAARELSAYDHESADRLRTHTATDYARVLATYGPTYANGWRAGRERAAELIEGGEIE